jgi:hypothetical protein
VNSCGSHTFTPEQQVRTRRVRLLIERTACCYCVTVCTQQLTTPTPAHADAVCSQIFRMDIAAEDVVPSVTIDNWNSFCMSSSLFSLLSHPLLSPSPSPSPLPLSPSSPPPSSPPPLFSLVNQLQRNLIANAFAYVGSFASHSQLLAAIAVPLSIPAPCM